MVIGYVKEIIVSKISFQLGWKKEMIYRFLEIFHWGLARHETHGAIIQIKKKSLLI